LDADNNFERKRSVSRNRLSKKMAGRRVEDEDEAASLLYVHDDHDPAANFARLTQGFEADITSAPPNTYVIPHDSKGYRALDNCLDEIGAGKFQHKLLALSAFGHFVEAAEYSLLGLMLPLLMEEFKPKTETELAIIGSLTGVGMILGTLFFAQFSNTYGRRIAYQISLTLCVLFGLLSSFSESIMGFALMRCGLGFGYGGNLVSATTLLMEFTPSPLRAKYMNISGIAYAMGALFVIGLAWGVVPQRGVGWRWLLRIVALCSIPTLLLLPFIPESPRFYIMRRRPKEALDVVRAVAKANDQPLPRYASVDAFTLHSEPLSVKTQLARLSESWRITVPLALVWFVHSVASAITAFIPLQISKRDEAKKQAKFEISMVFSIGCLIGSVLLLFTSMKFGRLSQLRFGLVTTAILTACIGLETSSGIYIYIVGFFLSIVMMFPFSMLYLYTGEVHQTETRTIAFAICQFGHRFAPVFSPFIVAALNDTGSFMVTGFVFAGFYLISFFISLFLRVETFGRALVEADDFDKVVTKYVVPTDEEAKLLLKKV
jgi:MFS family permease